VRFVSLKSLTFTKFWWRRTLKLYSQDSCSFDRDGRELLLSKCQSSINLVENSNDAECQSVCFTYVYIYGMTKNETWENTVDYTENWDHLEAKTSAIYHLMDDQNWRPAKLALEWLPKTWKENLKDPDKSGVKQYRTTCRSCYFRGTSH